MSEGIRVPNQLDGKLEPEAKTVRTSISDAALLSIAVSLKRVADTLSSEGVTAILKDNHHDFTNLAFEAGRSFQHGVNQHR